MNSYNARGSRLDRAIERAVRDITGQDPRPGLSRRVLRRIEGGSRTARFLPLTQLARLGAIAAAAVVLIAVATMMRDPGEPQPAAQTQAATTPSPTVAPDIPSRVDDAPARQPVASAARRRPQPETTPEAIFGARRDRVAAASLPVATAAGADALEPITPTATAGVAPLAIDPLGLVPIEIRPITIPALPSIRDRGEK